MSENFSSFILCDLYSYLLFYVLLTNDSLLLSSTVLMLDFGSLALQLQWNGSGPKKIYIYKKMIISVFHDHIFIPLKRKNYTKGGIEKKKKYTMFTAPTPAWNLTKKCFTVFPRYGIDTGDRLLTFELYMTMISNNQRDIILCFTRFRQAVGCVLITMTNSY